MNSEPTKENRACSVYAKQKACMTRRRKELKLFACQMHATLLLLKQLSKRIDTWVVN